MIPPRAGALDAELPVRLTIPSYNTRRRCRSCDGEQVCSLLRSQLAGTWRGLGCSRHDHHDGVVSRGRSRPHGMTVGFQLRTRPG